jgi:hypothetical protein
MFSTKSGFACFEFENHVANCEEFMYKERCHDHNAKEPDGRSIAIGL